MSCGSQSRSRRTSRMHQSYCAPHDTVIIFDWDDTLLCTSAIHASKRQRGWSCSYCGGESSLKSQLFQLERAADACLRAAMKLGDTMIVTNGSANWVQRSLHDFVPRLTETLDCIEVVSARDLHDPDAVKHGGSAWRHFPMDPDAWKRAAFQHIVANRRKHEKYDPQDGPNLIVIGDSESEMMAAHHAADVVGGPNVLVKTVKFREDPSVAQLIGQLQRTAHELESLVNCTQNTSIILKECQLNSADRLGHMSLRCSSGWKFCDYSSWSSSGKVHSKPPVFGPRRDDDQLPRLLGRTDFVNPELGPKRVDYFGPSSQSKAPRALVVRHTTANRQLRNYGLVAKQDAGPCDVTGSSSWWCAVNECCWKRGNGGAMEPSLLSLLHQGTP